MNSFGNERASVQQPLINYATDVGWEYIAPEKALRLRGGETGFLFKNIFINQMQRLNPLFMNQLLAEELIKKLERIAPNIEGNLTAWEYLKGLKTVFVSDEKRERNVRFIDTEDINNNTFNVTDEFSFTNGNKTIRPDIVFLINGIPLLIIETKAANKIEGISEALNQIKRYHRECPELLSILQIYSLTHIISYYYSATWNTSEKGLVNWKEETKGDFEILIKTFLDKQRVVKVLTDFILFTRQDDELKKAVLRPHQIRAVNKIVERAKDTEKKRGLIWHTQGSGKTYTMIVTAQKIIKNHVLKNPTVIMLVDRNELETQLFSNLAAVGIEYVEVAQSKAHLKELLLRDTRGLIVTMIHKFDGMPADINNRENIFILVDEAHRTTGGKLGNYLMGALPHATYIGFTGTPIDKTSYGEGTFITFGRDDAPNGYLDKYSTVESIDDGNTIPLHYALASSELLVDRETLEKEFLDLAEAEGMSDPETLNKVLEKAVTLKNILKTRERINKIAHHAANHYKDYIELMGYKAFLIAVDREACTFYKEELDRYLPSEYSKVVYSANYNDREELSKYHLSLDEEKRIRKSFIKPDELPKILIVTEKLLTGFDAPILYCIYLDKPMRDHVLLQTIARVNRPYEDNMGRNKTSGFVLDFVGIFSNLEKALAFDSQDIEGVVRDIEVLKNRFTELMEEASRNYLSLIEDKSEDKAVEVILKHFKDEERRHEYYQFFRELSDIYDIISPDAFLRPYLEDFEELARIYKTLRESYEPGISINKDFSKKTVKLIQEHTISGKIKGGLDIYEINGDTLTKIEESDASDTEKVFNLIKSIEKDVKDKLHQEPYLASIGKKVEEIAKFYKQRQKSTQEALEELKELIKKRNAAKKEQEAQKMPSEVFSIFWLLKNEGIDKPKDKALQMGEVLNKHPHWRKSEAHERKVKNELYSILIKSGIAIPKVTEIAQNIIRAIKSDDNP